MKNKIIHSTAKKRRSPLTAGVLSFFFTGLGQYYNGEAAKGTALFLLRVVPILLLPVRGLVGEGASPVKFFFFMVSASLLVWLAAVPEAAVRARGMGAAALKRYNTLPVYAAFAALSTLALSAAVMTALVFFGLHSAAGDRMEPGMLKGDALLADYGPRVVRRGDVLVYRADGAYRISRVAALPGDAVAVVGQTFSINGMTLPVGVLIPAELSSTGLPNREDLFFEVNGAVRYAIRADGDRLSQKTAPGGKFRVLPGMIFFAGDNRRSGDVYEMVESGRVLGKITGIVYSASPGRFLSDLTMPPAR